MSRIKYGIDLGTTNSAISVIEKGKSTIVKNQQNKDTTPHVFSLENKEYLLGIVLIINLIKIS